MGCEKNSDYTNGALGVAPGLGVAANPGLGIYKEILDSYSEDSFINDDGSYNYKTIVERTTGILVKHGLKSEPSIQNVDGINVYPPDYFCPIDFRTGQMKKTKNTRAIHWFSASWHDEETKRKMNEQRKALKKDKLIHLPNRIAMSLLGKEKYDRLKKKLKRK